jgi:hypothetical protein
MLHDVLYSRSVMSRDVVYYSMCCPASGFSKIPNPAHLPFAAGASRELFFSLRPSRRPSSRLVSFRLVSFRLVHVRMIVKVKVGPLRALVAHTPPLTHARAIADAHGQGGALSVFWRRRTVLSVSWA